MADARPLYLLSGLQKQLQAADVIRANHLDTLATVPGTLNLYADTTGSPTYAVNLLTASTGAVTIASASTGIVSLGAAATTLELGGAATMVSVNGDLTVDGDEIIVGDTTFDTNVTFGNGGGTDITFAADAQVISNLIFSNTGSWSIQMETGGGTNFAVKNLGTGSMTLSSGSGGTVVTATLGAVDITTVTSGAIGIAPASGSNASITTLGAGTIALSAAAAVTVDSTGAGVSIDAAGISNFTTTSGGMTIQGVGLTLEAGTGAFGLQADTASTVNVTGGNLTLSTSSSGSAGGNVLINAVFNTATGGEVHIDGTAASYFKTTGAALTLETTGAFNLIAKTANGGTFHVESATAYKAMEIKASAASVGQFFVGAGSPDTVVTANKGDIYLDRSGGAPWFCDTDASSSWTQVGSAAGGDLQQAYVNGPAINITTGEGDLAFTATSADFTVTSTAATQGDGMFIVSTSAGAGALEVWDDTNDYIYASGTEVTLGSGADILLGLSGYVTTDLIFDPTADASHEILLNGEGALSITKGGTVLGGGISITAEDQPIDLLASGGTGHGVVYISGGGATSGVIGMASMGAGNVRIYAGDVDSAGGGTGLQEIFLDGGTDHANTGIAFRTSSVRCNLLTGTAAPTAVGGVVARTGSLYCQNVGAGTTGGLWIKQANATATDWKQVATTDLIVATTLQNAYVAGNTIEMAVGEGSLTFESLYNGGAPLEFVVRHEGGGDNFLTTTTTSATAGTLDLGSTNVTIKPLNNIAFDATGNPARSIGLGGSGTLTISQTGTGAMTVATTATGALTLTSAVAATWSTTAGLLNVTGAGGLTATATTSALTLTSTAANIDVNSETGLTIDNNTSGSIAITNTGRPVTVVSGGTSSWANAAGGLTISTTGSGALTLTSADAATWSTAGGALTVRGQTQLNLNTNASNGNVVVTPNGTGYLQPACDINFENSTNRQISISASAAAVRDLNIWALKSTGNHGANIYMSAEYDATGTDGGSITLDAGDTLDLQALNNVSFTANGSSAIPINSATAGQTNLDATLPQNVVGAINALLGMSSDVKLSIANGEAGALTKGNLLYVTDSTGTKVFKSDAGGTAAARPIGFANNAAASGASTDVLIAGEVFIVPVTEVGGAAYTVLAADIGKYIYMSNTVPGAVTLDAGDVTGTLMRVGVVTVAGAVGTCKAAAQFGEPVGI